MNWQKNTYIKILICTILIICVVGAIFYLSFSAKIFKKSPSTTPTSTEIPIKTIPIEDQTKSVRSQLNVERDTASWRGVENSKLNYSIKFPQDITYVNENIKTHELIFAFTKDCNSSSKICEGVYISAVDVPTGIDLKQALDKGYQGTPSASLKPSYQNIEVAGESGLETFTKGQNAADFDSDNIYFLRAGKLYIVKLYTSQKTAEDNIKNFNLILQTFKFLK